MKKKRTAWNKGLHIRLCPPEKLPHGNKHPKWKGGIHKMNGYVYVYSPKHPYAFLMGNTKYIGQHRLVMEKHLGRYLKKNEVVHHKNHKHDDNRIENLELTTSGNHIAQHNRERIWKDSSRKKQVNKTKRMIRRKDGTFGGIHK